MLRAVLFDLDDTLVPETRVWREALQVTCAPAEERMGLPEGVLSQAVEAIASARYQVLDGGRGFSDRFGVSWEECLWGAFGAASARQLPKLPQVAKALRRTVWADALKACGGGTPQVALELELRYPIERRRRHKAYPDAAPTVGSLRERGLVVACVTNGASEVQREKLRESGAESFFDVVLVSGEEGVGKPDPAILQLACERCGVAPAEAIYVGNSPARDVACARAASIRSVLVDREHGTADTSRFAGPPPADRIAYEVHGLIGFVDGWLAGRAFRALDGRRRPVAVDEPEPAGGRVAARYGPEQDELRPAATGEDVARAVQVAVRALRARAGDEVWHHEKAEVVDWDALLR